jgi:hypothetical protein
MLCASDTRLSLKCMQNAATFEEPFPNLNYKGILVFVVGVGIDFSSN